MEFRYISFHVNAFSDSRADTCGQTDGRRGGNNRHVRDGEHAPQKEGDEQQKSMCVARDTILRERESRTGIQVCYIDMHTELLFVPLKEHNVCPLASSTA